MSELISLRVKEAATRLHLANLDEKLHHLRGDQPVIWGLRLARSSRNLSLAWQSNPGGLTLRIVGGRPVPLRLSLVGMWLLTAICAITCIHSSNALATTAVPTCSASQLRMSIFDGGGAYSAAGNQAEAFIFRNISQSVCTLRGYPKLRFTPDSFKGESTKILHAGGQIFVAVPPRLVVIKPSGSAASFGLSFGDAYNQSPVYNGASCMTRTANVWLPVQPHPYSVAFTSGLKMALLQV